MRKVYHGKIRQNTGIHRQTCRLNITSTYAVSYTHLTLPTKRIV